MIQAAIVLACTHALMPALAQNPSTVVGPYFNRIATFEAHRNVPAGRTVSKKSVAEIVAASADGR